MLYLILAGLVALVVGVVFFFFISFCKHPCEYFDRVLLVLDEKLNPFRLLVGVVLLAVGAWILYLAFNYPEYPLMYALGGFLFVFGVLFVFFPHWLSKISEISNRTVFHTDKFVGNACKGIGLLLVLSAIYILVRAFLIR